MPHKTKACHLRLRKRPLSDLRPELRDGARRGAAGPVCARDAAFDHAADPCLRHDRGGGPAGLFAGRGRRRARGTCRRRAGPLRLRDGRRRDHPPLSAGGQRGDRHPERSCGAGLGARQSATPALPPRSSFGATSSRARSSPSAMRRQRCFTCWNCSMRAARNRR